MSIDTLKCPHCGEPVSAEVNGGRDLGGAVDLFGQRLDSWYICVCYQCWKRFDIVNGKVTQVRLCLPLSVWRKSGEE